MRLREVMLGTLTHLQVAGLDLNLKLVFYKSNEVTQAKIHEKYLFVVLHDDNCQILRTFLFSVRRRRRVLLFLRQITVAQIFSEAQSFWFYEPW